MLPRCDEREQEMENEVIESSVHIAIVELLTALIKHRLIILVVSIQPHVILALLRHLPLRAKQVYSFVDNVEHHQHEGKPIEWLARGILRNHYQIFD